MRRVGQRGRQKDKRLQIFKMAHMSLQLSPYHFMKVSYAKRHLKNVIKTVIGTSRILEIIIIFFNQKGKIFTFTGFQVDYLGIQGSSRILV